MTKPLLSYEVEDFFRRLGDHSLRGTFYDMDHSFTIEELYQVFRARLLFEIEKEYDLIDGEVHNG